MLSGISGKVYIRCRGVCVTRWFPSPIAADKHETNLHSISSLLPVRPIEPPTTMATTSSTSTTTTTTVTINRPPAAPVVPKRPPCDSRRCCCRETSLMHPTYAFPLSIPNSQRYEFSLFCDAHVRTLMSEHLAVIPLPPTEPRLEHAFFMFVSWTLYIIVLAFFEQWGFFEWAPDANPFDGRTWSNEGGRTWCVYFTIVLYVWLRTPNVWPRLRWGDLRRQYCRFFFVWGLGHMTICLPFAVKLAVRFVWQTMPLLTLEVLTDVWYIGMLEVSRFICE